MKKLFILFVLLFGAINISNADGLQDVGIAKYAVLEVLDNNTPLRLNDNENAYRLTHLFKDAVLFADKQNDNYYRVELKEGKYAWVNKKFVEVQAVIPEKRFDTVEKITFKEEKDRFKAKIDTPSRSAFIFEEKGSNLDFTLYDNRFDPIETKVLGSGNGFKFSELIKNEFNLNYISTKPLFGYYLDKAEKGYILTVKKSPKINKNKPLKNIRIVVDPGHGGDEKGACAFGLEEKTINLQISKKLKRELEKRGAKVYLTRKKDKKVPLYDRPLFAIEKDADIMLSIHQNSLPDPKNIISKYGVGIYYYHNQALPLAKKIQENLILATDFRDDGVNFASFVLTRPTMPVSVLVECGYIIRKEEADKISNPKFQKIIAKGITKGVEEYLAESFN